jgi:hypothetical protein
MRLVLIMESILENHRCYRRDTNVLIRCVVVFFIFLILQGKYSENNIMFKILTGVCILTITITVVYFIVYYIPKRDEALRQQLSPTIGDALSIKAIPTLEPTPTNRPLIPTKVPTLIPTIKLKLTEVKIEDKTYQCQEDKSNNIREAYIKYNEAVQKWKGCVSKGIDATTNCMIACSNVYSGDEYKTCTSDCRSVRIEDYCPDSKSQQNTYLDIVNDLISRYCK